MIGVDGDGERTGELAGGGDDEVEEELDEKSNDRRIRCPRDVDVDEVTGVWLLSFAGGEFGEDE